MYIYFHGVLKDALKGSSNLHFLSTLGKIALGPPLNFVFSSSPFPLPVLVAPPINLDSRFSIGDVISSIGDVISFMRNANLLRIQRDRKSAKD